MDPKTQPVMHVLFAGRLRPTRLFWPGLVVMQMFDDDGRLLGEQVEPIETHRLLSAN